MAKKRVRRKKPVAPKTPKVIKSPDELEKEKREMIIGELKLIQQTVGWKVILNSLRENVKDVESKLHGEQQWDEGDTIELLQSKRSDRMKMMDLPKTLIEHFQDAPDFPVELDPYEPQPGEEDEET